MGTHFIRMQANCPSLFMLVIVTVFHGAVFPQEVERLKLLDDEVSPLHQGPDLLGVRLVLVLHEGVLQALLKISRSFGVVASEIQQLEERNKQTHGDGFRE